MMTVMMADKTAVFGGLTGTLREGKVGLEWICRLDALKPLIGWSPAYGIRLGADVNVPAAVTDRLKDRGWQQRECARYLAVRIKKGPDWCKDEMSKTYEESAAALAAHPFGGVAVLAAALVEAKKVGVSEEALIPLAETYCE